MFFDDRALDEVWPQLCRYKFASPSRGLKDLKQPIDASQSPGQQSPACLDVRQEYAYWLILSILWGLEASGLTMPHFPWIGKSGIGISGLFSFLKHLVFISEDPRRSIVSSLCAQLRYKVPLEEMEAAIEFLKEEGGPGGDLFHSSLCYWDVLQT